MNNPNLAVKIGKLKLKNPVMAASGTFGDEYSEISDIKSLGVIIAKTVTLNPRTGNSAPRIAETASGMLNAIGLENKGVDYFIKEKLPALKKSGGPIIASIAGDNEEEFKKLAKKFDGTPGIAAIELNLSCPNVKHGNRKGLIAQDPVAVGEIVKAVKGVTGLTIIAKLSPNVTDITEIAKAAESAGADAVSLVNTFIGMAINVDTRKPILGNITGGLSGPAIKPLALRMVWDVHSAVDIPIIGIGGIMDWKDALEFIIAGATAIQIGTATFVNPNSAAEIVKGIRRYLIEKKIRDINDLRG